jgi:NaMN:DMB phosphoribosyltransferase
MVALTPETAMLPEHRGALLLQLGVLLSCALAAGGTGNYFLWRRGRAALAAVALQQLPDSESMALIRRVGGVSRIMLAFSLAFALGMMMMLLAGGAATRR